MDGWRKFSEVRRGDTAYGYNFERNKMERTPVTSVNVFDEPSSLVVYENSRAKWECTPDHKNVVVSRGGVIKRVLGKDLREGQFLIGPKPLHEPPKKNLFSRDFIAIAGWVMSEGSYRQDGSIMLGQSVVKNPRYVKYLSEILGEPKIYKNLAVWRIVKDWAYFYRILMPNKVPSHKFITDMNNCQRRLFLYEFFRGDGNCSNGQVETYMPDKDTIRRNRDFFVSNQTHRCFQKSPESQNAIQMLASLSGFSTYLNKKGHLTILQAKTMMHLKNSLKSVTVWDEGVWCPTTGLGSWICRAYGRVFITGNSHPVEAAEYGLLGAGEGKTIILKPHKEQPLPGYVGGKQAWMR